MLQLHSIAITTGVCIESAEVEVLGGECFVERHSE